MRAFFLLAFCALSIAVPASAQDTKPDSSVVWKVFDKHFGIGLGADIGIYTPQMYGGGISVFLGRRQKVGASPEVNEWRRPFSIKEFYGVSLDAGLYGGGYRLALRYFAYDTSFIAGGTKLGIAYYNMNSNSWFARDQELIGIEFDINLLLQIRTGILYDVNRSRILPSFGLGFSLNPRL